MKLFVSYSHSNKSSVEKLLTVLREGGHDPWIDVEDLRVGDDWRKKLEKAIDGSDAIVLGLTPQWLDSEYCQWEFVRAIEMGKQVIPILLKKTLVPKRIAKYQYADFRAVRRYKERKEKFFDDLLELSVHLESNPIEDSARREELERSIGSQLIQTGKISHSKIQIKQVSENYSRGSQGIGTHDINHSTVTINQNTSSGEKEGCLSWGNLLIALIALIILIIGTFIAILALDEREQCENFEFLGVCNPTAIPTATFTSTSTATPTATFTPIPTATPTPLPTSTPSPTPTILPDAGFYVIVAGFGYQEGDQVIDPNTAPRNISNAVKGINDRVDNSLQELAESSLVDGVVTRNDLGVGYILDVDPLDRERKARSLAETSNADLVIYGVVRKEGIYYIFEPSFYINRAYFEPDLFDRSSLTAEIIIIGGEDIDLDDFQSRLVVVQHFVFGLLHYIEADYEAARAEFALAIAEDERTRQTEEIGTPLLYIYAGNSALRQEDFEAALFYFNTALEMNYPRAYIGRGLAIFAPVRNFRPTYNPDLSSEYLPQMEQNLLCGQRPPEPEEEFSLTESPLEGNNQKRVFMAIDCYEAALASIDRSSDIGLRALLGLGEAYEWLSRGGGNFWEQSDAFYSEIITIYEESDVTRQDQLRFWAGHAYGGHATALTHLGGTNDDYAEAVCMYELAISLLTVENYYNKVNQNAIEYYQGEVDSFRYSLQAQDITPVCDLNRVRE